MLDMTPKASSPPLPLESCFEVPKGLFDAPKSENKLVEGSESPKPLLRMTTNAPTFLRKKKTVVFDIEEEAH